MQRIKIFISSVQREFAEEREMLAQYIGSDALLGRFFEVFLFEQMPASSRVAREVYLEEVKTCDVYLGLIGETYGFEDEEGVSPTEREYDLATELKKTRLVYVKRMEGVRQEKEEAFLQKVQRELVRKTFTGFESLRTAVYASLVRYLEEQEYIRWQPFDAACDSGAKYEDLDEDKIYSFLGKARAKRNFALPENTKPIDFLKHLDLIDDRGRPSNAAVLLFGKKPQKYFITSEVKCAQFYGTIVEKPMPSYQIYKGTVFELVDQAVSFVMSRVDNWVGIRNQPGTAEVPTHPELPLDAVHEAIVNAVCHRDYTSRASVQVMLFRDRVEVWSPGPLHKGLTVQKLLEPHKSMPNNPLLAEPMYLAGYIEKVGTGTEDIIKKCVDYGLKKPEYYQDEDFRVVIWRQHYNVQKTTDEDIAKAPSEASSETPSEAPSEAPSEKYKLTSRQSQVLVLLQNDATISAKQIGLKLGITRTSVQSLMDALRKKGRLRRVGPDKGGRWEVMNN